MSYKTLKSKKIQRLPVDIWTKVAPDPEERPALIDPESVISFAVTAPAPVAIKLPLPKLMLEPVTDIANPELLRTTPVALIPLLLIVTPPNVPVAPVILPANVPEAPVMFPLKAASPLLAILKFLEAITPFDSIILVPAVVKAEP